jgi:hypothetical protein
MAVGKFEDQLLADLMREYGSALQRVERPTAAGATGGVRASEEDGAVQAGDARPPAAPAASRP